MLRWLKRWLWKKADPLMGPDGEMIPFASAREEAEWQRRCDRKDRLRGLNRLLDDPDATPKAIMAYIEANEEWDVGFRDDAAMHIMTWHLTRVASGRKGRDDLEGLFPRWGPSDN